MGTSTISPPRRALALTIIIFWSAATLAEALPSWLKPEERVEQRQQDEDHAGHELAGQEQADDAGAQEHDLHRVGVLAQQGPPAWLLGSLRETVRAELGASGLDLGRRQAGGCVDGLRREGILAPSSRATPVAPRCLADGQP